MPASPSAIFRFGPYESRPRTRELYKHGCKLKIRPQPLQLLNLLLNRPGDLLTREELRRQLWSSETFVDFEHGLNNSIKELRAILGDSPSEPRFIQTLPKLGYRFIAAVEIAESAIPAIPARAQTEITLPDQSQSAPVIREFHGTEAPPNAPSDLAVQPRSRHWWTIFGLATIMIAVALGYLQWARSRPRPQPANEKMMLAVLPFSNLTGDEAQEYFSDGLTEEMISQLGRLDPDRLGVIARTSVMHYKHGDAPLDQIGRELGVQYVLEGSVRRDSEKVRITAQLIQVKGQTHLWSRQYDRELGHLLTLQGEIAQEISDEIQLALGQSEKPAVGVRPVAFSAPKSYEAYDFYLKGRYYWNKRTPQAFQQAVECFTKAVAIDPTYARAYAGLADSYALMSAYYVAPPSDLIPKARAAALKALELDEKLAEAHVSLALIVQNYNWDWETSEKEFRRGIALDPNYATAHHWYAEHLALLGRFDQAFSEMQRARELDPLSLIMQADNGVFLYFSRQYDRAIQQFRAVLDLDPNSPRAHTISLAYAQQGRFADALADIQTWRRIDAGYWPWIYSEEAYVYGRQGNREQARRTLDKLQRFNRRQPIDPFILVSPYIGLGDTDRALAALEKSVAAHSPGVTALKVDPVYDSLRGDSRFQLLLHRIGLAQ
jgi:TolB-like protein/DNA-binding winged helix-turn-helix (wHTH) protein/Tfp pilus assembly protein PilF